MNLQRLLVTGAGGGAVVVWIATAATSMPPQPTPTLAPPPTASAVALDKSSAMLASEIARLGERLRPTAVPLEARDLFQYAPRRAASRVISRPVAPEVASVELRAVAAPPPVKLIGIAEDGPTESVVRTAIISGLNDLFLVKQGESLASRYRVAAISVAGVELIDTSDDSVLRLTLP